MKHGFGRLTMPLDEVQLELNMKAAGVQIISTKQLRAELDRIAEKAQRGASFLVLHRGRPAFEIMPAGVGGSSLPPLEMDPLYRAEALGKCKDGLAATDYDRLLHRE